MKQQLSLSEICKLTGLDENTLHILIEREWIIPAHAEQFDDEDLARVHFILELEHNFGANEAAIPIILHLVDQLHHFRNRIERYRVINP
jgi:chaperone modulatory protein CbpM